MAPAQAAGVGTDVVSVALDPTIAARRARMTVVALVRMTVVGPARTIGVRVRVVVVPPGSAGTIAVLTGVMTGDVGRRTVAVVEPSRRREMSGAHPGSPGCRSRSSLKR